MERLRDGLGKELGEGTGNRWQDPGDQIKCLAFTLRLESMKVSEKDVDTECTHVDKGSCSLNGKQKL